MKWTRPIELRAQIKRRWDRGELLASIVTGESLFPMRLVLKTPTSNEMSEHFDEVRVWVAEHRLMPHCRVEMREFKHRLLGTNAVPQEVWIESVEDALTLIGKQRDVARFTALLEVTRKRQPQLLAWLAKRPLRALEFMGYCQPVTFSGKDGDVATTRHRHACPASQPATTVWPCCKFDTAMALGARNVPSPTPSKRLAAPG